MAVAIRTPEPEMEARAYRPRCRRPTSAACSPKRMAAPSRAPLAPWCTVKAGIRPTSAHGEPNGRAAPARPWGNRRAASHHRPSCAQDVFLGVRHHAGERPETKADRDPAQAGDGRTLKRPVGEPSADKGFGGVRVGRIEGHQSGNRSSTARATERAGTSRTTYRR